MSVQRKKAEQAAADVLAILETRGISDVSDSYYSSSDQEVTPRVQKLRGSDSKKAEGSANSGERGSELEKLLGPELEPSAATSRHLPWKGRRDPSHSIEKFKDSPTRRRGSFACVGSFSRQQLGKSCRQIKRRDQRSFVSQHSKFPFSHIHVVPNLARALGSLLGEAKLSPVLPGSSLTRLDKLDLSLPA